MSAAERIAALDDLPARDLIAFTKGTLRALVEIMNKETMLLRAALVEAGSATAAEQAARMAALVERYRADAARREAAFVAQQQADPRMQRYKAREKAVVAEVMAMKDIPGGLTRNEYLRQRLLLERERAFGGG